MGNMEVIGMGDWDAKKAKELGLDNRQDVLAVVKSADVVPVGDVCCQDLELCFEILSGPSKGRQVIAHIPLWDREGHLSVAARAGVLSLCRAVGLADIPSDSSAFVGKALRLRLRRLRGSQHQPSADYLPCGESDRKTWAKWAEDEAKRLNAEARTTQEEIEGNR
jgi:hypothetical protein